MTLQVTNKIKMSCPDSEFSGHLETAKYLVKFMVFPVVKYGCESWTVKKAER